MDIPDHKGERFLTSDQDTHVFGNSGLQQGTTDRPLVTFAVFAYNQEGFIRDAVEGAFAQTYEPLEIILSDDCSSDQTYELMREMAAGYRGPHRVVLRRSPANRGLIQHINDVAPIVSADIVVLAAGDDVSAPDRTHNLVCAFVEKPGTMAVCSSFAKNRAVSRNSSNYDEAPKAEIHCFDVVFNAGGIGLGATYAYHRDCFFWPAPMAPDVGWEDKVLPLRAAILGRVRYIGLELVSYRKHGNSVTAALAKQGLFRAEKTEKHWNVVSEHVHDAYRDGFISKTKELFFKLIVVMRRHEAKENSAGRNVALISSRVLYALTRAFRYSLRTIGVGEK